MDLVASPEFLNLANSSTKELKAKIIKVLSLLSNDPKHPSLHFKRVKGAEKGIFECRVDQNYRMIVAKHRGLLRCMYLDNHDEALRKARVLDPNEPISFIEEVSDLPTEEFWSFRIAGDDFEKVALID